MEANKDKVNLSEKSKIGLIRFIRIFHKLYLQEYDCDFWTNALLRKFNYDREHSFIEEESKNQVSDDFDDNSFNMSRANRILNRATQELNSENIQPWSTMQVAFAYHSKDQDVIIDQIDWNSWDWILCKRLSIPIWVKSIDSLKQIIESVAKTAYKSSDIDDGKGWAHKTALWYILINKKNILWSLFKAEQENKVYDLLSNDFTQDRWKKAADKNAMALLAKK